MFVMQRIIPGGMQDADADFPTRVHVGVEEIALEFHRGRGEGVVVWEGEGGGKETAGVGGVAGPRD